MSDRNFQCHVGIAAPMLQANIDTDAIMPSREMKRVSKSGLGDGLFAGWRYLNRGEDNETENPDFILNQSGYRGASILLTGSNMGCGSSREFAVWALADYGIRAILAPSFAAIFHTNCIRNGVLPVTLDDTIIISLASQVEVDPERYKVSIDLVNKLVEAPDGKQYPFDIDPADRKMLLDGLDLIDVTLTSMVDIDKFEALHRSKRSWARLS